jgi:hypothetical protein
MKISHTPQPCRNRIGCRRPPQLLNAPITDTRRVRRPDGEADTRGAFAGHRLRAKALCDPTMPSFGEQVDIELPKQRRKGIRILRLLDHAVPVDAEPVVPSLADFRLEQSRRVHAPEGGQRLPRPRQCRHGPRPRQERPDHPPLAFAVRPKQRERIAVPPLHRRLDRSLAHRPLVTPRPSPAGASAAAWPA